MMTVRTASRLARLALVAAALPLLAGCVAAAVGAAGTGAVVGSQERSAGGAVDDTVIRTKINEKLADFNWDLYRAINLQIDQGRVLVSGPVPNPQARQDVERLIWQVPGVREVYNETEVQDAKGFQGYSRDSWILTRLRSELTFDTQIASVNYSTECSDGVVYLLGTAQNQAELDRVLEHARTIDGVRRVVSYVRIKAGEPTPAARPAGT